MRDFNPFTFDKELIHTCEKIHSLKSIERFFGSFSTFLKKIDHSIPEGFFCLTLIHLQPPPPYYGHIPLTLFVPMARGRVVKKLCVLIIMSQKILPFIREA